MAHTNHPMTRLSSHTTANLLKGSAILWGIWGMVHLGVGLLIVWQAGAGHIADAIHGMTPAVDLTTLQIDYPASVGAIIQQHGWNLGWFGVVTLIGSVYIWKQNIMAIFATAVVGGLADIGYFVFIDLAGLALPPGPQMTYICGLAIVLSFYAYFQGSLRGSGVVTPS